MSRITFDGSRFVYRLAPMGFCICLEELSRRKIHSRKTRYEYLRSRDQPYSENVSAFTDPSLLEFRLSHLVMNGRRFISCVVYTPERLNKDYLL